MPVLLELGRPVSVAGVGVSVGKVVETASVFEARPLLLANQECPHYRLLAGPEDLALVGRAIRQVTDRDLDHVFAIVRQRPHPAARWMSVESAAHHERA